MSDDRRSKHDETEKTGIVLSQSSHSTANMPRGLEGDVTTQSCCATVPTELWPDVM